VLVTPGESILTVSVPTAAPPQVAWEFLTKPGQRMRWQPWVTSVEIQGAIGGRRGPGSANHCMHGKDAVVEEILDWRPYDYVTDRTIIDTPAGQLKLLHTIELEPLPSGTMIHYRFAPPRAKKDLALAQQVAAAYGEALRSSVPTLIAQLEGELARRQADRGPEPELAAARPGGPLAGITPLQLVY
jgi:uncharacterized protein YndB with AHSA1/START domain